MQAAPFAHVLDRLIDSGPGSCATASTTGILTSPLLGAPWVLPRPRAFRELPRTPRARRTLSPAQRAALGTLRRHGARLDDDFDRRELKSAFRELARQLHPDMHPHATPEERAWLASAFREAREAYLALLA